MTIRRRSGRQRIPGQLEPGIESLAPVADDLDSDGLATESLRGLIGSDVMTLDGEVVGKLTEVHVDDGSGQPLFLAVDRDPVMILVPAWNASASATAVTIAYPYETVAHAPTTFAAAPFDITTNEELFAFWRCPFESPQAKWHAVLRTL